LSFQDRSSTLPPCLSVKDNPINNNSSSSIPSFYNSQNYQGDERKPHNDGSDWINYPLYYPGFANAGKYLVNFILDELYVLDRISLDSWTTATNLAQGKEVSFYHKGEHGRLKLDRDVYSSYGGKETDFTIQIYGDFPELEENIESVEPASTPAPAVTSTVSNETYPLPTSTPVYLQGQTQSLEGLERRFKVIIGKNGFYGDAESGQRILDSVLQQIQRNEGHEARDKFLKGLLEDVEKLGIGNFEKWCGRLRENMELTNFPKTFFRYYPRKFLKWLYQIETSNIDWNELTNIFGYEKFNKAKNADIFSFLSTIKAISNYGWEKFISLVDELGKENVTDFLIQNDRFIFSHSLAGSFSPQDIEPIIRDNVSNSPDTDDVRPLAVMLTSPSDLMDIPVSSAVGGKTYMPNKNGFRLLHFEVESPDQLVAALKKATFGRGKKKASLILISSHAGMRRMGLPGGHSSYSKSYGEDLRMKDLAKLLEIRDALKPGGVVVLRGCRTAEDGCTDNMANMIRCVFPQAKRVYGTSGTEAGPLIYGDTPEDVRVSEDTNYIDVTVCPLSICEEIKKKYK